MYYANFTRRGCSATTAIVHGEMVGKRRWVSEEQFALSFALGRLTPGTNVLAFCVGIGWILERWAGAIIPLLAASIPCTIFVVIIPVLFDRWRENALAQAAIKGATAAAVAVTTVWTMAHPHFKPGNRMRGSDRRRGVCAPRAPGISPIDVLLLAVVVGFFLPELA